MSAPRSRSWTPRRVALLGALGVVLAIAVAAFAVWFVWFSSKAPGAATIDTAVGALESPAVSGSASTAGASASTAGASAGNSGGAASSGATGSTTGVDGTWTVDPSVGSFADYSSAWAGFRVKEVLQQIGDSEAVGRTPDVTGDLTIVGTTLQTGKLTVDLSTIKSDQSRRDPAIQRALETGSFPTATFELTKPVDFGSIPASGKTVSVDATGTLTIHGTAKEITIPLQAQVVNGEIAVVGSAPLTFTDFGITMPTAPVVVSVENNGTIEFQLFFKRS
jgi:polyisoprenoid-binding protein YceI